MNLLLLAKDDSEYLEGLLGSFSDCRIFREPPANQKLDCVILAEPDQEAARPQWWDAQLASDKPVLAIADSHPSLPHLPSSRLTETTLAVAISWARQHCAWRLRVERAQERNRQILAQVTHELRSPITVISLAAQLAMRPKVAPERLSEHLAMVKESSLTLQTLVNDILDYSKMRSGTLQLSSTEFEFEEFLRNVCLSYRLLAQEKGLELQFVKDMRLPNRIIGDPGRLRQILANLLSNAVKFTKEGSIALTVGLSSKSLSEIVPEFRVRDSGVGISANALGRIFEPYEQADDTTYHQFGGTGLGLSIVKSLVQQMGGQIQVQSRPAEGTEFCFTVKLGRVRSSQQTDLSEVCLEGIPALVLQAAGPERSVVTSILSDCGLRVWTAGDTLEALRLAPVASHGVVLVHIDAFDFEEVEKLQGKLKPNQTKILVTATTGQRGDAARCQALGVGAYLTGEIEAEELAEALRLTLSNAYSLVTKHTLRERRNSNTGLKS